ncbi:hypothetical protein J661_0112 [Acinetobacter baumannii 1391434]|nr:hypothetical protein J661_0112 [Acinetobacter baumannii 1391434]
MNEEELEYNFKHCSKNIKDTSSDSLYYFEQDITEVKDHLDNGRMCLLPWLQQKS